MNNFKFHNPDLALFILRMLVGFVFVSQGAIKWINFELMKDIFTSAGFAAPEIWVIAIIAIEFTAATFIILGVLIRLGGALLIFDAVAAVLFLSTAGGIGIASVSFGFWTLTFAVGILFLLSGPGKWAIHSFKQEETLPPSVNSSI